MEMKMEFLPSTIPPPEEDSPDLSDEEIQHAIPTGSEGELAKLIAAELVPGHASVGKSDARYALHKQELKRRKPHLYNRVSLCCTGEPDKVFVYLVDWLQGNTPNEQQ